MIILVYDVLFLDLIVQAKSGTGKTCVFAVIALESLILDTNALQVSLLTTDKSTNHFFCCNSGSGDCSYARDCCADLGSDEDTRGCYAPIAVLHFHRRTPCFWRHPQTEEMSHCSWNSWYSISWTLFVLKACLFFSGRLKQLIENGHMNTDSICLFVLDEADKLMDDSFQESVK